MSATAQTLKGPRQQNLPLPVKLSSKFSSRGISVTSLRPGDWIKYGMEHHAVVIQNSAKTGRIEIEYTDGSRNVLDHPVIADSTYLGQGRRRWWWPLLPELVRKYVSQFARP